MVHNLRRVVIKSGDVSDFNRPFGLDWALEASARFKKLIDENTRAVFCETIGNPAGNIVDLEAVAAVAHAADKPASTAAAY